MENYIEELEDLLPKYIQRKPEEVEKYTTQQLEDYMALIGDIIKLLLKSPRGRSESFEDLNKYAREIEELLQRLTDIINPPPQSSSSEGGNNSLIIYLL